MMSLWGKEPTHQSLRYNFVIYFIFFCRSKMPIDAEIKTFKCKICDFENGQKSFLKKHIESVHYGSTGCRVFKQRVQN